MKSFLVAAVLLTSSFALAYVPTYPMGPSFECSGLAQVAGHYSEIHLVANATSSTSASVFVDNSRVGIASRVSSVNGVFTYTAVEGGLVLAVNTQHMLPSPRIAGAAQLVRGELHAQLGGVTVDSEELACSMLMKVN